MEINPAMQPIFYGTSLCALDKTDGGIRHIAAGLTLRRLIGKTANHAILQQISDSVSPSQLGAGTTLGAEAAVHSMRTFVRETRTGQVLLKVDFRNAFNTVRRDWRLTQIRDQIPGFYSLAWQSYATPSKLKYGDKVIDSA